MFGAAIPFVSLTGAGKIDIPADDARKSKTHFGRTLAAYVNCDWLRCLSLAFIGILVRFPALQGERIWDDHYLAFDNPFIKSPLLALEAFRHYLFLDSFSAHYRPVQNISYMADYFFWNTNEFGFHLTNVLLHVGSGVLLFFLLRRMILSFYFRTLSHSRHRLALKRVRWFSHAAFLIALLWTVHPVHSAAIDYISGRADSLAFLFAAAGWLFFLRGKETVRPLVRVSFYLLASVSGLLALCSREIAFVWIALFATHILFVDRTVSFRRRAGTILCCTALIAAYIGLRQLPAARPATASANNWSAPTRISLMARALGDYGRLMIFPANLHMERTIFDPGSCRSNREWRNTISIEYLSIFGLLVLATFVFVSAKPGRGRLMRIFGASWFFAAYLPVSNIVQLNATVAEHWLYLPSVGFLLFIGGCLIELPKRYSALVAGFAIFVAAGLSVRSYLRSTDWVTAETFYRRTMAAGGTSARTGLNLGQIYANRGDFAQAEKIFRRVLELVPDYPIAQNNLASLLAREGKNKEAEALFAVLEKNSMKTRTEFPCTWMGALNLARMRHNAKDDAAAMAILERAETYFPEVWELIRMKSEILREKQGPDVALRVVENFARANWWHHGAALALGRLYAQRGDVPLADEALGRASRLDVHDTDALRLMVEMRLRENKFDEAYRMQQRAVARQPDQPSQYLLLSDILERMGRNDEARAALAQASHLRALVQSSSAQSL